MAPRTVKKTAAARKTAGPRKTTTANKTTSANKTASKKISPATKRAARRAARQGGYQDRDFDFRPDRDQLSREELAASYQQAVGIIYSVPELQSLFEEALNSETEWSPQRLVAAVQNSNWYKNNSESARRAWAMESMGGADWEQNLSTARNVVRSVAASAGADLSPEELEALAKRYIYEDWTGDRSGFLTQALSEQISYVPDSRGVARLTGAAGDVREQLQSLASANGLRFSDNWFLSAAKSVASGLTTVEDWDRDIREQAAGYWPAYAEKIRSGMNVYDLASPYIQTMAQEFEINPADITLGDSYIRSALSNMDEAGNAAPKPLWQFQKELRNDPRWMKTNQAQNQVTSTTGRILQMFGFM